MFGRKKKSKWEKRIRAFREVQKLLVRPPKLSVVVPAVVDDAADENLLFCQLGGAPILARTLLSLDHIPAVDEIIVVIREADLKSVADIVRDFAIKRVSKLICVRESGLATLEAGVYACDEAAYIAVHDPLRPFVSAQVMEDALRTAVQCGVAVPTVPVKDTIKIVQDGVIQETPERSSLHTLQTPQIVESSLLKAALIRARELGISVADVPAALEALSVPIRLAEGAEENVRVGNVVEIQAAEAILRGGLYI